MNERYKEIQQRLEELRRLMPDQQEAIAALEASAERAKQENEPQPEPAKPVASQVWETVKLARAMDRPRALQYIGALTSDFVELHGDRCFADDEAVVGGVAMFRGRPVTVLCTEKGRSTGQRIKRNFGMPHPEGYRKALRLMEQAQRFRRPVLCFIDTSGAYCGVGAEERGQGQAIALNLQRMGALTVPVVSVVVGEGFSGGALALGVCDRLIMLENSVYSVITPEGCASILYKDAKQAARAAESLKMTAQDLMDLGICDEIVAEPDGGLKHGNLGEAAPALGDAIERALAELTALEPQRLLATRYAKYRQVGVAQ